MKLLLFSALLLCPPTYAQISSSALYSLTPSAYVFIQECARPIFTLIQTCNITVLYMIHNKICNEKELQGLRLTKK
jgi:hypothetical protein